MKWKSNFTGNLQELESVTLVVCVFCVCTADIRACLLKGVRKSLSILSRITAVTTSVGCSA